LAKLNLNKRCNRFRDQIIKQTDLCSPPALEAPETCESPDGNGKSQTAVTPISSNFRRQQKQLYTDIEEVGENMEDPILSQFSSEPSSIESFSDSSISLSSPHEMSEKKDTPTVDQVRPEPISTNKRRAEEGNTKKLANSSKRPRISNSKQTTLNAWLVKK